MGIGVDARLGLPIAIPCRIIVAIAWIENIRNEAADRVAEGDFIQPIGVVLRSAPNGRVAQPNR